MHYLKQLYYKLFNKEVGDKVFNKPISEKTYYENMLEIVAQIDACNANVIVATYNTKNKNDKLKIFIKRDGHWYRSFDFNNPVDIFDIGMPSKIDFVNIFDGERDSNLSYECISYTVDDVKKSKYLYPSTYPSCFGYKKYLEIFNNYKNNSYKNNEFGKFIYQFKSTVYAFPIEIKVTGFKPATIVNNKEMFCIDSDFIGRNYYTIDELIQIILYLNFAGDVLTNGTKMHWEECVDSCLVGEPILLDNEIIKFTPVKDKGDPALHYWKSLSDPYIAKVNYEVSVKLTDKNLIQTSKDNIILSVREINNKLIDQVHLSLEDNLNLKTLVIDMSKIKIYFNDIEIGLMNKQTLSKFKHCVISYEDADTCKIPLGLTIINRPIEDENN